MTRPSILLMEREPGPSAAVSTMTSERPGKTIPAGFEKVVPGPGLTMMVAHGVDGVGLASRILDPAGRVPARHFGRAGLHAVALADGGDALVRSYRHGGWLRGLTRDWFISRPPRPFAELAVTAAARERGLATVEIVAALVAHGVGPWYRGWLVTRELKGADTLWGALRGGIPVERMQVLLRRVGRTLRLMHEVGVEHADLNLRNILVVHGTPAPEVYIIDFDKARLYPGHVPAARGRRNLRRLLRSVNKLDRERARIRPGDWDALLDAYRSHG